MESTKHINCVYAKCWSDIYGICEITSACHSRTLQMLRHPLHQSGHGLAGHTEATFNRKTLDPTMPLTSPSPWRSGPEPASFAKPRELVTVHGQANRSALRQWWRPQQRGHHLWCGLPACPFARFVDITKYRCIRRNRCTRSYLLPPQRSRYSTSECSVPKIPVNFHPSRMRYLGAPLPR